MRKELTVRGLIIGIFITLVFTAANVVLRAQSRAHVLYLDPRSRDFDGHPARVP